MRGRGQRTHGRARGWRLRGRVASSTNPRSYDPDPPLAPPPCASASPQRVVVTASRGSPGLPTPSRRSLDDCATGCALASPRSDLDGGHAAAQHVSTAHTRLYVGNLHYSLTCGDVLQAFSPFGSVVDVDMPIDPGIGHHKGFAFIQFEQPAACSLALQTMQNIVLVGRRLRVGVPASPPPRHGMGPPPPPVAKADSVAAAAAAAAAAVARASEPPMSPRSSYSPQARRRVFSAASYL